MKKEKFMYFPEWMLKCADLHPHDQSKLSKFYNHYTTCLLFTFLTTLAVLEVAFTYKNNFFEAIEGLSSVLFMIFTFCRYTINYYKKPELGELLNLRSKFWDIENFQGHICQECDQIIEATSKFINNYKNYAVVLAAIFYLQPFLLHELQMKIYVPEGWFYYLNVVYWYMTPPLFVSCYGVTSMFCAICIPVTIQFKLLASRFENFCARSTSTEMKELIDYHNFLIQYCKKINKYSNSVFLFEFFITVSVCCILIFIASNDYPFVNKIKYVGFIFSQFLDTAIFCYNAELISEASGSVSRAIYSSKWTEFDNVALRKDIILIILRAQKNVTFSGHGVVWINMKTFTQVFKVTLSFVSYLNTLAQDE